MLLRTDRQCTHNVTLWRFSVTTVVVENKKNTYSECVFVVLGIQHSMRMCQAVICCLPVLLYFPRYLIKDNIFDKKRQ